MGGEKKTESVAIIGGGASGAVTASAFLAENYYQRIRVFERREAPGGAWLYDGGVQPHLPVHPGDLPPQSDPKLQIPEGLPRTTPPNKQNRYLETPVYHNLTTNVPDIAMSFSDARFAYGPFVPHDIPRQYLQNYFSTHKVDKFLELNTTVEDVSVVRSTTREKDDGWKLTLRKHDAVRDVDIWWEEYFDVVILANGHYTVPFIPHVKGLDQYIENFPGRVVHSKSYRIANVWKDKKVVVVGNSSSGIDVLTEVLQWASHPVYQSRRSKSRWDDVEPPAGVNWKPVISEFLPNGRILFTDGSYLDDVDAVIYCTGYKPSFPFWNSEVNGRPLYDYKENRLINSYWHTWFHDFPTLAMVGLPRVLTFRSMEYQAIALARLFSGRQSVPLPSIKDRQQWESERVARTKAQRLKFHDVKWEDGQTHEYLTHFFQISGLGTLAGEGRIPPALNKETIWALENIKKYPEPGKGIDGWSRSRSSRGSLSSQDNGDDDWVIEPGSGKDMLSFI